MCLLTHIVLFRLKDRSPGSVEIARDILLGMKGKIPQLRHLEVGADILHSERSYDLALVTKFDSMKELKKYQAHPVHVEILKFMNDAKESSITVDYESE